MKDIMYWNSLFLMFTGIGLGYFFAAMQITYGANVKHVKWIGMTFLWILFISYNVFNFFAH